MDNFEGNNFLDSSALSEDFEINTREPEIVDYLSVMITNKQNKPFGRRKTQLEVKRA